MIGYEYEMYISGNPNAVRTADHENDIGVVQRNTLYMGSALSAVPLVVTLVMLPIFRKSRENHHA